MIFTLYMRLKLNFLIQHEIIFFLYFRETPIERLKSGPGLRTCDRPAIPVKPTHLSPIVANNFKRSPSDLRPKLNPVTNKINNTQSATVITEAKNGHLAGTAGMSPSVTSSNKKTEISEVENVRLNLHPVSNNTTPTTPANNNSKIHSDLAVSAKRPQSPLLDDEDGVKRISADSIQNIRRDGNVMSFQFTSAICKNDVQSGVVNLINLEVNLH